MTNLRKNLLVAGCTVLSLTLFSFTSTNATESKIVTSEISYQTKNSINGGANLSLKTCKVFAKVWRNTCAVAAGEVLAYIFGGDVTNNTSNSDKACVTEMNHKLNLL